MGVIALGTRAQNLRFADETFDAVVSIGSFEMIGEERPNALEQMVRVAKRGARIGVAEPMCLPALIPSDQSIPVQIEFSVTTTAI